MTQIRRIVRRLRRRIKRPNAPSNSKKFVIAMMPKAKGDQYFISCKKGADEAAKELGAELLWDGPTDLDPAKQNEVVEAWITRGVDAIAVSVENKEAISTVLKKAKDKGIKVVTWDADANKDARDFLINQATPQGIGETLTDEAARILGGKGEIAIVTASLSAANQNEWIKFYQGASRRKISRHQTRRHAAVRRRPRPRIFGNAEHFKGLSERQISDGNRRARRSRNRRSRQTIGQNRRQSDRTFIAEYVQTVYQRRHD